MTAVSGGDTDVNVRLEAHPERRLVRPTGSFRHIEFRVKVDERPAGSCPDRPPLALALVLDRSGSMSGDKIATAKRAAMEVLGRLDERDMVAVVVFDDRIDVLQPAGPATAQVKSRVRASLARIDARGTTALHEGWLVGCEAIASDGDPAKDGRLARCFLLTDGLANVGLTDPEQIASQAADIRERTGIGTSTFGIGPDYDERLLGPMAVAGGGQFHHLRTSSEIASTFVGELGEMLAVAARNVKLLLEVERGTAVDVVSAYATRQGSINVGDLMGGEDRRIVVRFWLPASSGQSSRRVRARVVWSDGSVEHGGDWQEVSFTYADHEACDAEPYDGEVMRSVARHHADRAQLEATRLSRMGDLKGARDRLRAVARRIEMYAGADPVLWAIIDELRAAEGELADRPVAPLTAKTFWFDRQRSSRGQRDLRGPWPSE